MISDDKQDLIKIGESNILMTVTKKNRYVIYVTKKSNINSIQSNDYIINISSV